MQKGEAEHKIVLVCNVHMYVHNMVTIMKKMKSNLKQNNSIFFYYNA